jgi:class 3 adenylate cyclase
MDKQKRILALIVSIIAITAVHYAIPTGEHWPSVATPLGKVTIIMGSEPPVGDYWLHSIHVLFQVLYVVPLVCGAYWFGLRGAAATLIAITGLYLPHLFLNWKDNLNDNIDQLGLVGIFIVVSITTGLLSMLEVKQKKQAEAERGIRLQLQRFISPLVVDEVLSFPEKHGLNGRDFDVSVLFVDICEFTRLSESLPPGRVLKILNSIYEVFGEVVFANEGTVNQIIGDAVMAIFGAPKEQSDHADRAVKVAIHLQNETKSLGTREGVDLNIRIGVNSGRVTAGSLGSAERMEYTVIGDTVNVANRLCTLAEPGQIVISSTTRFLLHEGYAVSSLGWKTVKGRTQPVEVFSIKNR